MLEEAEAFVLKVMDLHQTLEEPKTNTINLSKVLKISSFLRKLSFYLTLCFIQWLGDVIENKSWRYWR